MTALDTEQRERHRVLWVELRAEIEETRDVPDGYEIRFGPNPSTVARVAEFITLESLCCPFFGFTLELERDRGSLWLKLTGDEGVKPFIQSELGIASTS